MIIFFFFNSFYNNVAKASFLSSGSNYHLFKRGIKPMWEDPVNELGGKWVIQFPRNKTGEDINTLWLYAVSNLIVIMNFSNSEIIYGLVIHIYMILKYKIRLP